MAVLWQICSAGSLGRALHPQVTMAPCPRPPVDFQIISERTKPRMHEFQSEVFMIIGGCTKDERFVAEVTCLDPLRRSRLEVAKLPLTEHELDSENKKWVEFACVTLKNEVYISGKQESWEGEASPPGGHHTFSRAR